MAYQPNNLDNEPLIRHAINEIFSTYGDSVSVQEKKKSLLKFGRNPNVGSSPTGYTLWWTGQDQAHETYQSSNTNSIDSVSSSSASDTMQITVEGHTESGGNKTFVVQTATLSGTTRVALTTPLNRSTRAFVSSGSTSNIGEVYVYENTAISSGKPTDTTKIHLSMPVGKNQSEKASTSLSSQDYWIITGFRCDMLEKVSAFADVELQVRTSGGVWRPIDDIACTTGSTGVRKFVPYKMVPKNSDVRLVAVSDSSSRDVSGSIEGFLASII